MSLLVAVLLAAGLFLLAAPGAQAQGGDSCDGVPATVVGTNGSNLLFGTAGDDVIVANGGADLIFSGGGNDLICAGDGNDLVFAGSGRDVIYAGNGGDRVFGGADADRIFGEGDSDRLYGNGGDDAIIGGGGRNLLDGGSATDVCDIGTSGSQRRCERALGAGVSVTAIGRQTSEVSAEEVVLVQLRLDAQPLGTVSVGLESSDPTEGTVDTDSLVFSRDNWDVIQVARVSGVDDSDLDGDVSYSLRVGPVRGGGYDEIDPEDVPIVNIDDDDEADTTAPSIVAPADVVVEATGPVNGVDLGSPTVTDDVDPSPVVTNDAPLLFAIGDTTVTWTATDTAGNTASATQLVTVTDTTAPTIIAPDDVVATEGDPVELGTPVVSDLADPDPVVSNDAPATFPIGDTTVTWTATDASGNTATAAQLVTIETTSTSISGLVWRDNDYDDIRGPGDTGIEGRQVTLYEQVSGGRSRVARTTTSADGGYRFDDVAPGRYLVQLLSGGDRLAEPDVGGDDTIDSDFFPARRGRLSETRIFDVSAGGSIADVDAGLTFGFQVRGGLWWDGNRDGVFQGAEQRRLPLTRLELLDDAGGLLESQIVRGPRTYRFDLPGPGDYRIRVVPPAGYEFTFGPDSDVDPVTGEAALTVTGTPTGFIARVDAGLAPSQRDVTVTPTSGLTTTEGGGTATFSVVLDAEPSGPVTIPVSTSDATEGSVAVSELQFDTINWDVPVTVTVTGVDDADDDGDVGYTVVLGEAVGGAYDGIDPPDVVVTNIDDDEADSTAPTIVAPADVSVEATGPVNGVDLGSPTVNDDLDPSPVVTNDAPLLFGVGDTLVTWTATDTAGNTASATQLVTVTDTTAPTIIAPDDVVATEGDPVTLGTPTVTDLVDPDPVVTNDAPATFPIGDTTVTWTATDAAGNIASATQLVTIEAGSTSISGVVWRDNDYDDIRSPGDPGLSGIAVILHLDGGGGAMARVDTMADGSYRFDDVAPGRYRVRLLVPNGDRLVEPDVGDDDTIDSDFSAFSPATGFSDSTPFFDVTRGESVTHLDAGVKLAFRVQGSVWDDTNRDGVLDVSEQRLHAVRVEVLDMAGELIAWQFSASSFAIGLPRPGDYRVRVVPPDNAEFTIGPDSHVDPSTGEAVVTVTDAPFSSSARANAGLALIDRGVTVTPSVGLTTGEDGSTASFDVVLDAPPLDAMRVRLTSSDDTEGTLDRTLLVFRPTDLLGPGTWDIPQTVTVTGVDDTDIDGDVDYTIELTTDGGGYDTYDPADVTITNMDDEVPVDSTAPTIVAPADVVVEATGPVNGVDLGSPTVSDDLDPSPVVTNDAPLLFSVGDTTVAWTATDASGNTASATQLVTVTDTTAPTIIAPDDVVATEGDSVELGSPTVTDLADPSPVVTNDAPLLFGIGDTTVTWTATDASGNTATATQLVTIDRATDSTAPTIVAPADVSFEATGPLSILALGSPTVTDDVDPSPVVGNDAPAGFAVGDTTVTWTATDASGNTASATQFVKVTDTTAPTIVAPGGVVVTEGDPVALGSPVVSDLADPSPVVTNDAPAAFGIGDTTVTWTATDASGNTASATQLVTVEAASSAISISGVVWRDNDFDDVRGPGDPGIASRQVSLYQPGGFPGPVLVASTNTSTDGTYRFDDVAPGRYLVRLSVPSAERLVEPDVGGNDAIDSDFNLSTLSTTNPFGQTPFFDVSPGGSVSDVDAGLTYALRVEGSIWEDANRDGLFENEQALASLVRVEVLDDRGDLVDSRLPDGSGYVIALPEPGDYRVRFIPPANAEFTAGPDSDVDPATGEASVTVTNTLNGSMVDASAGLALIERGVTVTPSSGLTTGEDGTTASFDVVLDAPPLSTMRVRLASSDTTEGMLDRAFLTFGPDNWDIPQSIIVTGIDDAELDGDVQYSIELTTEFGSYNTYDPDDLTIINIDDEVDVTPGVTVTPTSGLITTEDGGTATFTIALDSEPTGFVEISIASSDVSEGTPDVVGVAFGGSRWYEPVTITVTGIDDPDQDGDVEYTIVLSAAEGGGYDGIDPPDVSITNTDDDQATPGVTVTPTSGLTTTEDGGTSTFTVVLDSQPTGPVAIPVSTTDATEGTADVVELQFDAGNWDVPATVTVTGVDDPDDDGDVAYSIVLGEAVGGGYDGIDPADVTATNIDDEASATAALSGVAWSDDDFSRIRELGEPGLADFSVSLFDESLGLVATTTTNGNGEYSFSGLDAGTYQVQIDRGDRLCFATNQDPDVSVIVTDSWLSTLITVGVGQAVGALDGGFLCE